MSHCKQKEELITRTAKGLNFILGATLCWMLLSCLWLSDYPPLIKLWGTFGAMSLMLPVSIGMARLLGILWQNPGNEFQRLGIYLSSVQILLFPILIYFIQHDLHYLLFALGIITGAHLLPFAWLYNSRIYLIGSVLITASITLIYLIIPSWLDALVAPVVTVIFGTMFLALFRNQRSAILNSSKSEIP